MNINLTLIGQMITFLLFVWFTKKFVWPPIINALKDRQAKIADGLAAAERGHQELLVAQERVVATLKESKDAAANIILDAKKHADGIVEEARQQAHAEGTRIIERAQAEIAHLVEQAKDSLRQQVTSIAMKGAEKILERSIDPAIHQDLLEKLAKEI